MPPSDDTRATPAGVGDRSTPEGSRQTPTIQPDPDQTTPVGPPGVGPGFVVTDELGRGAMGVVYRATQPGLNRTVAVKMLLGDAADPRQALRFLAEAEAVAAIDHPHVVRVFEYGRRGDQPYLAMEYLPGGNLSRRLADGRISPVLATRLVRRIAAGVAAAHNAGIVHRDLKPGNVLFDAVGEPKVADFGLAKRLGRTDMTASEAVLGTPAYMAPEQARGEARFVGPPADVWALGVILYECLTGTRPFAGVNSWEVLQAVMHTEPRPVRELVPGLPWDLVLIVSKCLAKEPADRYPSAAELVAEMDRYLCKRRARCAAPAG